MKVYIVLEHQRSESNGIVGTIVVKVFSDLEGAQSYAEDCKLADNRFCAKFHTDPCIYEVKEFDVI